MKFVLHYRGQLKSNGSPSHKHELRKIFHRQLKQLWGQPPLSEHESFLVYPKPREGEYSLPRPFGEFIFVPLVTADMNVIAELDIVLLRPESPGNLLTQGGDIDNRLKTLFDALTMPRQTSALPTREEPNADEKPFFYCLMEDDNLVTSVALRTEQLLEPEIDSSTVDITINVRTAVTRLTMGNGNFS